MRPTMIKRDDIMEQVLGMEQDVDIPCSYDGGKQDKPFGTASFGYLRSQSLLHANSRDWEPRCIVDGEVKFIGDVFPRWWIDEAEEYDSHCDGCEYCDARYGDDDYGRDDEYGRYDGYDYDLDLADTRLEAENSVLRKEVERLRKLVDAINEARMWMCFNDPDWNEDIRYGKYYNSTPINHRWSGESWKKKEKFMRGENIAEQQQQQQHKHKE
jgi:hypothetical protein